MTRTRSLVKGGEGEQTFLKAGTGIAPPALEYYPWPLFTKGSHWTAKSGWGKR